MTQEQLAMLLGVSRQSVTKWEAERSYPEMDKLLKICDIFECSLDDLVKGDLTGCASAEGATVVPAGPPTDVCGYDEHQRTMAWKVPTGIAVILIGVAIAMLFGDASHFGSHNGNDALFVVIVLAGVLAGLAFFVPAGMEHSAFAKAHPYVEDFYTEDDRIRARKSFSVGLVAGLAFIVVGIGCVLMLEERAENWGLFFLLFFIALGTWSIVHYGMLLGRLACWRVDLRRRDAFVGSVREGRIGLRSKTCYAMSCAACCHPLQTSTHSLKFELQCSSSSHVSSTALAAPPAAGNTVSKRLSDFAARFRHLLRCPCSLTGHVTYATETRVRVCAEREGLAFSCKVQMCDRYARGNAP